MTSRFTDLAVDCSDPHRLARFWCAVLGHEIQEDDDGVVTIGAPAPAAAPNHPVPPTMTFAHVPEPKTLKNRLHVDVTPVDSDQADEVRRLLDLGARPVDVGQGDARWVVLADPEGNEFCVLSARRHAPGPSAAARRSPPAP